MSFILLAIALFFLLGGPGDPDPNDPGDEYFL